MNLIHVDYYPGDFFAGTASLEPLTELAYRRIIDQIYITGDQLEDNAQAAFITKAGNKWPRIRAELIRLGKIDIIEGRISNPRCRREIEAARVRVERARKGGLAKQPPSSPQADFKQPASRPPSSLQAGIKQASKHLLSTSHQVESSQTPNGVFEPAPPVAPPEIESDPFEIPPELDRRLDPLETEGAEPEQRKRATRLSADWRAGPEERNFAEERGFGGLEIDDLEASFRAYFVDGPGRNKAWVSWRKAWENWVRRENPKRRKEPVSVEVNGALVARMRALDEAESELRVVA